MKYIYLVLIIVILITMIILFKKTAIFSNNLSMINNRILLIKEKANEIKPQKVNKETNNNHSISFSSIIVIASLLKEIMIDYKKPSKRKKSALKSTGKTLAKNIGKIRKIKIA